MPEKSIERQIPKRKKLAYEYIQASEMECVETTSSIKNKMELFTTGAISKDKFLAFLNRTTQRVLKYKKKKQERSLTADQKSDLEEIE